jgi:hypothetical protein
VVGAGVARASPVSSSMPVMRVQLLCCSRPPTVASRLRSLTVASPRLVERSGQAALPERPGDFMSSRLGGSETLPDSDPGKGK